jgi:hypothetical protein
MKSARHVPLTLVALLAACSLPTFAACGDDDDAPPASPPPGTSGGTGRAGTGGSGPGTGGSGPGTGGSGPGTGGSPQGVPPNRPNTFDVSISGEDLALNGYPFDPATAASNGDPPAFVDGWSIKFTNVLLTVGNLRLNAGPDTDPGDPTQLGPVVASAAGPWAVDVANAGPVTDKGSAQPGAWYLTTLTGDFDASTKYAFSYDTVAASAGATKVGFKADGSSEALYQQAVAKGWAAAFQGTATFVGKSGVTPPAPELFATFSKTVNFTIGLANPAGYVNCANPDLSSGGEGAPRGVQTLANQATLVQITFHTDHLFWDTLDVEGTPLHFDHVASQALFDADPNAPGVVTTDDLVDVPIDPVVVRGVAPPASLPGRSYVTDYDAPAELNLGPGSTAISTLLDFLEYSQQSGGHLNADGECEVVTP